MITFHNHLCRLYLFMYVIRITYVEWIIVIKDVQSKLKWNFVSVFTLNHLHAVTVIKEFLIVIKLKKKWKIRHGRN